MAFTAPNKLIPGEHAPFLLRSVSAVKPDDQPVVNMVNTLLVS